MCRCISNTYTLSDHCVSVSLYLLVMIYLDLTLILALVFLGKTSLKHVFNLFETTTNNIIQIFVKFYC